MRPCRGTLLFVLLLWCTSAFADKREAEVAAAFRAELPRIAKLLETQAEEIRVRMPRSNLPITVSHDDAVRLIDGVEAEMRKALPHRELAPFQDLVTELFAGARRRLDRRRDALAERAGPGRVDEAWFRAMMADLADFFRTRVASPPGEAVCFVTSGATVVLSSPSAKSDRIELRTNSVKRLYVGRYDYTISRDGSVVSSGTIDLLLNAQRIVDCSEAPEGCRLASGGWNDAGDRHPPSLICFQLCGLHLTSIWRYPSVIPEQEAVRCAHAAEPCFSRCWCGAPPLSHNRAGPRE